jgi:glutathione gamma-glutamylcysteinyltransferase
MSYQRTFYKRHLPSPPAVSFASPGGQEIFEDAMRNSMLAGFFSLIEQFRTQDEPAYCGLASVAMVLNSLAIDPRRVWKGSWRFFHEQMLDCCIPLERVRKEGITLSQAACLARCNGATTDIFEYGSVSMGEFRDMVKEACSDASYHLIVSYSRRHFLQTGDGHFSPIGGYAPSEDMVLILDTARFKYPPHWVPLEMLYEAMSHEDPSTGRSRGFLKVMASRTLHSVLFALNIGDEERWGELRRWVEEEVMEELKAYGAGDGGRSVHDLVVRLCLSADTDMVHRMIAARTKNSDCDNGTCVQSDAVETLLAELAMVHLFDEVRGRVGNDQLEMNNGVDGVDTGQGDERENSYETEKRILMVLMLEDVIVELARSEAGWAEEDIQKLKRCLIEESKETFRVVGHEIAYLKDQYNALRDYKVKSATTA